MNIPNFLSLLRIVIALIAPFYLISENLEVRLIAGAFCTLAVATDWIDGWYARKYNQVTKLGEILDPIADKVLVLISFSVFVYLDVVSIWWVIPIFIREIVVTIYRFLFLSKNIVVAAVKSGKIKTVVQIGTLVVTYIYFIIKYHFNEYYFEYFSQVLWFALIVTLYLTIKSGIIFFKNNWQLIKNYHNLV